MKISPRIVTHNGWLLAVLLILTGCATAPQPLQIRADVDALSTVVPANKQRFVLMPGNPAVSPQDLQFLEFKAYVEKALVKKGLVPAAGMEQGDLAIFLTYGVGEPQTQQYSYSVPVWNDSGFYPYYRYRYYSSMPVYTQQIATYISYRRSLTLEAYDMAGYLSKAPSQPQLWKINVQSVGPSNDLRIVFPFMVAAMLPYIGTNTGHMLSVVVDEFDPLLREIQWLNPLPAANGEVKP